MRIRTRTGKTWVAAGALVDVVIIILGVVLVVRGGRVPARGTRLACRAGRDGIHVDAAGQHRRPRVLPPRDRG